MHSSVQDHEAFFLAVRAGRADDVETALARTPSLATARWEGATPLHFAAIENHAALIAVLLAAGADPDCVDDEFGMTPLGWANERGHAEIVRDLAPCTSLSLHRAAAAGQTDHVRRLLQHDASAVNVVEGFGTPLHEATVFGREDIVELLLAHGADPEVPNREGHTAREIATAQATRNGERTPIAIPERRREIVEACRRIAHRFGIFA